MSTKSKGIKVKNHKRIPLMLHDRARGLTWGEIGFKYGYDRNNARRMVTRYVPQVSVSRFRNILR